MMRLVCAVLLAAGLSTTASAQTAISSSQPTARIRGVVKDATGAPLPNVTLTLTGAVPRTTQSTTEGEFDFDGLPAGVYELSAALKGFATLTRTLRLAPSETMTVALAMSVQFVEQAIVTAGKTGERDAQDTAMAMSVVTARELERTQAHDVEELARLAPSVTFSQNTGFAQLTIRGIGTNAVFTGSDPSSAVYLDGVYLARPAMVLADLLDVERVEVLRGPQGTLYGRNAVGGALNVVLRSPTNDTDAFARVALGSRDAIRAEAGLSGPIIRERVMGSVAVLRGVARGFVRDLSHAGTYLGAEDVTAGLGKLRFVLTDRMDLLWSTDVTHQDPTPLTYAKVLAVKAGFTVDNPPALHDVRTNTPGFSRNLQFGSALRFRAQLTPRTSLTSLTAFRKTDYHVRADVDITELDLTVSDQHEIHRQWSEEITLAYERPRLSWLAGAFLFDDRDRQWSMIEFGAARLDNRIHPLVDSTSKALFGQTTMAFTDRLSATAGLRYTHERKTIQNEGRLLTLDPPVTMIPGSAYAYTDSLTHHAWTPKVALEFRPAPRTLAYVSGTRGFKSGGFNASSREAGLGFAPEFAWSYEAGVKTQLGRTRLNLAGFYTDYSNLQVQITIRPGVLDISNAAAATITGMEAEFLTELRRTLRVGGYLDWLNAKYDRYNAVGVGGVMGDAAGHRLNNAPEWSGRLWLEWNVAAGRAGTLSLRPDVLWQSTVFFTAFNDGIQRQSAYGLLSLSAELQLNRTYSINVYARNLANQDYITGTFSSPIPAIGGRPGMPRQIGVELTLRR